MPRRDPSIVWPELSEFAHVSGRTATAADVEAERAVFVLEHRGKPIGKPLPLTIPQYAYHVSGTTRTPCILIQAESGQGKRVLGCVKIADRTQLVGLQGEFELLGDGPRGT